MEESKSGLNKDLETSEAKRLISSKDPIRSKLFGPAKTKDDDDDDDSNHS